MFVNVNGTVMFQQNDDAVLQASYKSGLMLLLNVKAVLL